MTLDAIFVLVNAIVFPAWVLLILAPRHTWTTAYVQAAYVPLILAAIYTGGLVVGIATDAMAEGASFFTLDGVMALFDSRLIALNGWIHFLTFDLFVGAWIARDAIRRSVHAVWRIPALLATFIFGPLGLLIYLTARWATGKTGWSLEETKT